MRTIKTNKEIIELVKQYNNTLAWEAKGRVYIDTMKLNTIKNLLEESEIYTQVLHVETREEQLFGIESTGLTFGGREINCHCIMAQL